MAESISYIRERVGAFIARENVTKKSLADKLGCTDVSLYNKLNGITQFTLEEAFVLADTIGCSVDDFRKPLS